MRLIDRDSLKHQIIETYEYEFPTASGAFDEFVTKIIPNIINNAPTIDDAPAVRGEWIREDETQALLSVMWHCSKCEIPLEMNGIYTPIGAGYKYCPNCGAKMDGEKEGV